MDPIILAVGSALVGAMATDAWQTARAAVVTFWRRVRPDQADEVDGDLVEVREQVLAARGAADDDTVRALAGSWQVRLDRLLRNAEPEAAADLAALLKALESVEPASGGGRITMHASASGHGTVYQAGRDQHLHRP